MHTPAQKAPTPDDSQRAAPHLAEPQGQPEGAGFFDNRPVAVVQRRQQQQLSNSPTVQKAAATQSLLDQSPRLRPVAQFPARAGVGSGAAPGPANATGLPDSLKAGVENLSGYALDDVRVHYNSPAPVQLQAHAYAQGVNIHLAPGQEKHLPHEAWHVVQQKQGRVLPTVHTTQGIALNDEAHLEAEADAQGAQASRLGYAEGPVMQQQALTPAAHRPLRMRVAQRAARGRVILATRPVPPVAGPVVQRIATQIETKTEKGAEVITGVTVRGRPTSVYSGSMGDHTTAFIVHVEGLNVNLQGKTIEEALAFMVELVAHLRELPGYESMRFSKSDSRIRTRYEQAEEALVRHLTQARATANADADVRMHLLQEAIDAYLEARELIPFSTINVGEKSKGRAGKGHGESGPAAVLSSAELLARNNSEWSRDSAVDAINALFDFQSAGMVATEGNKSQLARMTGGVVFAARPTASAVPAKVKDPMQRLKLMWQQHLLTIARLYPTVYARVQGQLTSDRLAQTMSESLDRDFGYLAADAERYLSLLNSAYYSLKASVGNKKLSNGKNIVMTRAQAMDAIYDSQNRLLTVLKQMQLLSNMNKRYLPETQQYQEQLLVYKEMEKDLPHFDSKRDAKPMADMVEKWVANAEAGRSKNEQGTPTPVAIKTLGTLGAIKMGRPIEQFLGPEEVPAEAKDSKKSDSKKVPKASAAQEETQHKGAKAATLSSRLQSMAIQVLLDETGHITGMLSAGRPASPFAGTMGAHSTAWTAHLDRVRALIRTQDIPTAYANMSALAGEVEDFYEQQQGKRLGPNAEYLIDSEEERMQRLRELSPASATLSGLQRFIEAILSFYNLIPDVSRERIDTTGKGEGTYRARLLTYETTGVGDFQSLNEALNGLFDGRGRTGTLWLNHENVMKQAYPYSYKFAREGKSHAGPKTTAPAAERESQEAQEEAITPLNEEQLEALEMADDEWLAGQNNCLINAIAEANGQPAPTLAEVIAIRAEIGADLGTMLFASRAVLDVIVRHLGLHNGVVVVYHGYNYVDETTDLFEPAYIYHDGINHFIPLSALSPAASASAKAQKKRDELKKRPGESEKDPEILEDDTEAAEKREEKANKRARK